MFSGLAASLAGCDVEGYCGELYPPLAGHSLSWADEKRRRFQRRGPGSGGLNGAGSHTMIAKIWMPEDPRQSSSGTMFIGTNIEDNEDSESASL